MSKRVNISEKTPRGQKVKVSPKQYKRRGKQYFGYIARWKEDGKWKEKLFNDESKADEFKTMKDLEFRGLEQKQNLSLSTLQDAQIREAEEAFKRLGGTYSLTEAIDFFLKHNRPPEFTISILDASKIYEDEQTRKGTRPVTVRSTKGVLRKFSAFCANADVHTITEEQVKLYLSTLRTRNGARVKRKTWNNHRNELASFFMWAGKRDLSTNRPFTFNYPLEHIPAYSNERVREERPAISTTSPDTVKDLFTFLMNFKGGRLVKWYALAYFAGIRPSTEDGELSKVAKLEDELFNYKTGFITIPAKLTKTKHDRQIKMSENLRAWLLAYEEMPIMPPNLKNDSSFVRKKFNLQQDETRHSFISYHVALSRSLGDTALQAGNSEGMIKKHYLNLHPQEEGVQFFSIFPQREKETCKAVFAKGIDHRALNQLRAI